MKNDTDRDHDPKRNDNLSEPPVHHPLAQMGVQGGLEFGAYNMEDLEEVRSADQDTGFGARHWGAGEFNGKETPIETPVNSTSFMERMGEKVGRLFHRG